MLSILLTFFLDYVVILLWQEWLKQIHGNLEGECKKFYYSSGVSLQINEFNVAIAPLTQFSR